jgi:hypothetical protein
LKKRDENLPNAIATHGGLLAVLAVLLLGTVQGSRTWILLIQAGCVFLISSALLKLLAAGVMQSIRNPADPRTFQHLDTLDDPLTVAVLAPNLESTEKMLS